MEIQNALARDLNYKAGEGRLELASADNSHFQAPKASFPKVRAAMEPNSGKLMYCRLANNHTEDSLRPTHLEIDIATAGLMQGYKDESRRGRDVPASSSLNQSCLSKP